MKISITEEATPKPINADKMPISSWAKECAFPTRLVYRTSAEKFIKFDLVENLIYIADIRHCTFLVNLIDAPATIRIDIP